MTTPAHRGQLASQRGPPRQRGFTLVELLIVVIILGMLAAMVVPRFSNAASDTKVGALPGNLSLVRRQPSCIAPSATTLTR